MGQKVHPGGLRVGVIHDWKSNWWTGKKEIADYILEDVDDLGRLLRQVHRVLKPSHPFVIAMAHPFADVHAREQVRPYGTGARTVGEWFTALGRANFRVDVMHELGVSERTPVPTTLVLRARKEGS